jgi:hypothetical protein
VATVAAFYRAFSPLVCSFSLSVLKRVFNLCALLSSFGARGDGGKETGIDGEWVEQSCGPHVQLQRSVGLVGHCRWAAPQIILLCWVCWSHAASFS